MIKLVPFCEKQLRDIREEDNINGLFRLCDISRAGNRVDRFTEIAKEMLGLDLSPVHLITQVYGCTLDCHYCYVTTDGIWGNYEIYQDYEVSSNVNRIIQNHPEINVFHLMGGAPALYLDRWANVMNGLSDSVVFHSDFLLNEGLYDIHVLKEIANHRIKSLFAVSLKPQNIPLSELQLRNLKTLRLAGIKFYITYTGAEFVGNAEHEQIEKILQSKVTYYNIKIKHYKSLE